MGCMKHICKDMEETLDFMSEKCKDGYVIVDVDIIEFDHYLVTYVRRGR